MQDNTEMARELQDIAASAPLDPEEIKVLKARWPIPDFVDWPETPVLGDDQQVVTHTVTPWINFLYISQYRYNIKLQYIHIHHM